MCFRVALTIKESIPCFLYKDSCGCLLMNIIEIPTPGLYRFDVYLFSPSSWLSGIGQYLHWSTFIKFKYLTLRL